jgi:excisionase family DNA binding protein
MTQAYIDQRNDILRKQDVAELLQCTERHVEDLIRRGDLKAYKPSHRMVRIFRRDVEAFLEKFCVTA